jgi:hypothetical protein
MKRYVPSATSLDKGSAVGRRFREEVKMEAEARRLSQS